MKSFFLKTYIYSAAIILALLFNVNLTATQPADNPDSNKNISNKSDNTTGTEKLTFEIENINESEQIIREHLLEIFPIISESELSKIIQTSNFSENKQNSADADSNSFVHENVTYKVTFEVPKNYLMDTVKILWKLNIPEFQSRIYQLYGDKEIYIDTWPNVVGTAKDKTYTGNFTAYKIRNWPFYKDPDPEKASLPPTKPGPGNPLGLFVVHYDENSLRYFHGTNNPKVLNNKLRNLSHGCVRNDNDNIAKMKEFIIKRVVKSKDLSSWLGSKKTLIYDFEEIDKFPVQIVYKTFEVDNDSKGKYIMLFKDVYNYNNPSNINTRFNNADLITLTETQNIFDEYRKTFGNDIQDEALRMMIDYVINNGEEYEKYYIDDLKEKFHVN